MVYIILTLLIFTRSIPSIYVSVMVTSIVLYSSSSRNAFVLPFIKGENILQSGSTNILSYPQSSHNTVVGNDQSSTQLSQQLRPVHISTTQWIPNCFSFCLYLIVDSKLLGQSCIPVELAAASIFYSLGSMGNLLGPYSSIEESFPSTIPLLTKSSST